MTRKFVLISILAIIGICVGAISRRDALTNQEESPKLLMSKSALPGKEKSSAGSNRSTSTNHLNSRDGISERRGLTGADYRPNAETIEAPITRAQQIAMTTNSLAIQVAVKEADDLAREVSFLTKQGLINPNRSNGRAFGVLETNGLTYLVVYSNSDATQVEQVDVRDSQSRSTVLKLSLQQGGEIRGFEKGNSQEGFAFHENGTLRYYYSTLSVGRIYQASFHTNGQLAGESVQPELARLFRARK